ncbi:MAG: ATP-binding protein [Desulfobulbus sp.]|nr:ATP-binding protein [Desulfobulbus sp.]
MRVKAALIIIAIAFAITVADFGSSLILTRQSLTETMGKDISLALDIANDLVSTRISLYKSNAQTVAERLMQANSTDEMKTVMREQLAEFPDFVAFAVSDRQGLVAEHGDSLTSIHWLTNSKYTQNAFAGKTVISSTSHDETTGKLVMHICTPMGGNRVLSVTIPGMIFSDDLAKYRLWNSGNIWMIDEEGTVIAHFSPEIVDSRADFLDVTKQPSPQSAVTFLHTMLSRDKGLGTYSQDGAEYQCAYARVSASELGWRIALSVPLAESPIGRVQNRLLFLAALFFVFSVIVAVLTSRYIAQPYDKIAEQNRRLEELNQITQSQADTIQEAHQRTKLMMDATPICSMLWKRNGTIFDCNEECVNLFDMKDKQDFLDQFFKLSPDNQPCGQSSRKLARMYLKTAFEDGRLSLEWMHQLLDGTPIPCEMTLVRVIYDDDYIVAAYARDLREHKRMMAETLRLQTELEAAVKKAQEANHAKSSFLANMSHEMRTPLNAVIGLSELILNTGEVRDEVEDRLGKIHTSGMTLLGIVNDILDISKIESGKFELQPIEYATPSLINDIVSLNIVRIGEKPIRFILTVDEGLPGHLLGDDLRVKQVFNNLLSNAFKYTNSGTVEWIVSFKRDGDDIWIVSDIKDTGIGIKPKDIQKLFEDYSQVDAQTNRKAEGTGLGLSITKRLIGMMDGTITLKSEYGKGSTFSVRLRQQFVSDTPIGKETAHNLMSARFTASKRAQSANLTRIDLSYARVLVVDDMPTNLDVAKGMLMPYGIRVDCAASGQQAIDLIRAGTPRYDAVFMDHMMPGMDGIEATRIIREEIGTDYAIELPIIALTANAIAGNEKMFLSHGFQAFISKPIDMIRLDSVLRQWARNKDHEKEHDMERGYCIFGKRMLHAENGEPPLGGVAIDGVDIAAGLERFAGEEAYIKVLQSYAANTRPLLAEIQKHLASGDLNSYAIAIHGIKGSSFGMAAIQAGTAAERLERLAIVGETERILAENGAFIEYMENLLDSIDGALAAYNSKNRRSTMAAPDPSLLQELREACGAYDAGRVDAAMSRLESFAYESGAELIAWLREQVEEMNYAVLSGGDWPLQ